MEKLFYRKNRTKPSVRFNIRHFLIKTREKVMYTSLLCRSELMISGQRGHN